MSDPITISLFRGINSLRLACGERTAYITIDPSAINRLVQIIDSWTSRHVRPPAEAHMPQEEIDRMVEDWKAKHPDDITADELKELGL